MIRGVGGFEIRSHLKFVIVYTTTVEDKKRKIQRFDGLERIKGSKK